MFRGSFTGGYNNQQQVNLADMSESHLMALGQQGNPSHAQLLEMQNAQQGMRNVAQKNNIEVPQVNFYPSRHPDPRKARKQDIKQARKLLKPTKRAWYNPLRWVWGMKYPFSRYMLVESPVQFVAYQRPWRTHTEVIQPQMAKLSFQY